MRRTTSFCFIFLFIFFLVSLSVYGCWNRRELNNLALVFGVALDKGKTPGILNMTVEVVKPEAIKAGTQEGGKEGGGGTPYLHISSAGPTDFSTIRNFTFESSRKLFFAHNKIIVFGEELAKEGIIPYLDLFLRNHEPRRTSWVLVAKGRGEEILDTVPGIEKTPAMNISKLVENRKATSEATGVDLHEFATRLISATTAPVMPLIEVGHEGKTRIPLLSGTAVFKKDKMVGTLDKKETRGMLWVIGEVGSGVLVVPAPGGKGKVSLEIIRASSKITPEIKNGNLIIKVAVKEEGNLGDQSSSLNLTEPAFFTSLERRQAEAIREEILAAVKKAKKYNSDIFGFGEAVHRSYPQAWKDIEKKWDQHFPQIQVVVEVEARLRRIGLITQPSASK